MALLAVRLIDLAIFGSLGALWIGGFVFIVVLYRWILRFEREQDPTSFDAVTVANGPAPERAAAARHDHGTHRGPANAHAHEALVART